MQKVFIVILLSIIFFSLEFLVFNLLGKFFLPNLSLILIVFINLSLGIRYSLLAALILGFCKDALGIGFFGVHTLSFVCAAFLAVVLQKYVYHRGSEFSRLILVFFLILINFSIQLGLNIMNQDLLMMDAIKFVLIPQIISTLLVTNFCFDQLKSCVLKYLV